jgi:hypothetical protein
MLTRDALLAACALALAVFLPPAGSALSRQDAAAGASQPTADVIVLDAGGRPVSNLAAGDFTVAVDGTRRRVIDVTPLLRIRTRTSPPADAVDPGERLVVVVVDEASITRGNERSAVAAARRLLDRMVPNERVALVRLPASASRLVLSPNGPAVQQSARAVIGRMPPPGLLGGAAADAAGGFNDDADPTDERGNVRPLGAQVRAPHSAADRAAEIDALALRVRQASASSVPELGRLLDSLKGLPGPKTIFFLSAGIATDATTLRAVARSAAVARAQVHVVQLAPATWQREVFASQPAEAPSEESAGDASQPALHGTAGLPALASAGGGLFAAAEKKVDAQVDRVLLQAATGYLLRLEPGEGDEIGRTRTLEIALAHRAAGLVRVCPAWTPGTAAAAASDRSAAMPVAPPGPPAAPPPRRSASMTADAELLRTLEQVGEAVGTYVRELSSVVAEERYRQATYRGTRTNQVRVLRSDFLLLQASNGIGWTPFRDVFEVDGKPVRDREERLKRLFLEQPQTALREALRIKEESVRYLLGDGNTKSNVNWPTLALEFLLPSNQWRFAMRRGPEETVDGIRVRRIDYAETAVPTVILTYDRLNVPARGSFWIEPATGRVLKTTLQTGGRTLEMTITVTYRPSETLGLFVPVEMREEFSSRLSVLLEGKATYSNFRRFQVSTVEEIKVPKSW